MRETLQTPLISVKNIRNTWQKERRLIRRPDIDHESLKQPGVTYLTLTTFPDEYDCYGEHAFVPCTKPCCIAGFSEFMDAFAGPLGVVLNPERYTGDWWVTEPDECVKQNSGYGDKVFRWFGMDNFFLNHPVLASLVLGMFRQGALLFAQGFDQAVLKKVTRKEVVDALSNSDPVLAMRILNKLRPWIEAGTNVGNASAFPFPAGYWDRLPLLYKGIYKYGYEEVFDGSLMGGWNIGPRYGGEGEVLDEDAVNDRYEVANGPLEYWGTKGRNKTAASKRLESLGK
jgi:hypothetical protein